MFCAAFLANLYNNLSCILHRKFRICFALLFLANLYNNLSCILHRKFRICLALFFWLICTIICRIYYIGNFVYVVCFFFYKFIQ